VALLHDTGDQPGEGLYCCTVCGSAVQLDDAKARLPRCHRCGIDRHLQWRTVTTDRT